MKKQITKIALALLMSSVLFTACKKDKPEEPNDNEVITTMTLTFVPVGGGATVSATFDDSDGPGGIAPTQQPISLAASKTYNVTLVLLDKTKSPVSDITAEVATESAAHRFYYAPSAASNITVSGLNNDVNGVPLGITSTWITGAAASGTIKVVLRHYEATPPNKALGDPIDSPKSNTDIEVNFNTAVI
ncbi:MAG: hypothetical protein LH615_15000 [Ferruginibacter sp.]|nr:hypothetical protein [Ferruginibacter sp.]